jgi:tetratricopeptide (TPR) repeat protein
LNRDTVTREPLISLAVIARDEAASLPRLLDDHRRLWDEAIVIDTGSRDDTVAVAQRLGARVEAFAWCDDFSAARNAALACCRGPWVLVLDADEHISAADQEGLRALVAAAEPAGIILPQWNYADDPGLVGWVPVGADRATEAEGAPGFVIAHQVRLFPAADALRYCGRVHETIEPSLLASGLGLVTAAIPVHHRGHRGAPFREAERVARDGRLLRLKLHEEPTNPRARYEMAVQLLKESQPDLARRLLESLVAAAPDGARSFEAWSLLGRLALASGDREGARDATSRAIGLRPDLAEGWLDLVRVRWLTGDQAGAHRALSEFARLFPKDPRLPALTAQVQAPPADNNFTGGMGS